jgi:hypothetical protein
MARFKVTVQRMRLDETEIELEAEDRDDAEYKATRLAESDDGSLYWAGEELGFSATLCEEQLEFDGNGDATV